MSERRHPNIVNIDEIEQQAQEKGKFSVKHRALAGAAGGRNIGCGMVEVPPGKTAWPFHYHFANEEALYILSGTGTARIGDQRIPIRAGDYLVFPPGKDTPHQTINTGTEPLVYLALSTMLTTEVVGYPDSGKIGAMSATYVDGKRTPLFRGIFREAQQADYYEGELDE
jgi:uncharacterized cupin superfamily protein